MANVYKFYCTLFVISYYIASCASLRNRDSDGGLYEISGYEESAHLKSLFSASSTFLDEYGTSRGLGISAWGIIAIIISIILAIVGMYYFSICFPVVCAKPKKYDVMDLPPAV